MIIHKHLKLINLLIVGVLLNIAGGLTHVDAQPGQFFSADWHPNDEVIAISDGYTLSLYTTNFTRLEQVQILDQAAVFYGQNVSWSPDGNKIAVNLSADPLNTPSERILQVWSWDGIALVLLFEIADIDSTLGVAWHPDGTQFAAVPLLQEPFSGITIYSASTGQPIVDLGQDQFASPTQLAWSPDGTQLAFDGDGGSLRIWDVSNQQALGIITNRFHSEIELDYSPTDNLLAFVNVDNVNNIEIWDTDTFQIVQTLSGHSAFVSSFEWGTGGLVSAGYDDTTRFWNIVTGQEQTIISTAFTPSWDPSGTRWVANEGNNKIRIREAASGLVLVEFDPVTETVLLAPIADAGEDQTVTDADSNSTETVALDGTASVDPDGTISSYEWSENENIIATGATPQVTLSVGVHTITLTVTDNDGLGATDEVVITVESGTTISCDISVPSADTAGLIAAITTANGASGPTNICLAENSTYLVAAVDNSVNAFPQIINTMTIFGNGATIQRDASAPELRFFRIDSSGSLTLDNLTIRGGLFSTNTGAALDNDGQLTLEGVTLDNNQAHDGGAIDNHDNATLTVNNSTFTGNTGTDDAGAIYSTGALIVNNSTFSGNTAAEDGGAIRSLGSGTLTVDNSSFTSNMAGTDGGAIDNTTNNALIRNTNFSGNSTTLVDGTGGAINHSTNSLTIEGGSFTSNSANDGGAIDNDALATLTIENATFTNNSSTSSGGAIHHDSGTLTISGSNFTTNTASSTGGAIRNDSNLTISGNTTFDSNQANGDGGAIYSLSTSTTNISDSSFTNNSTNDDGGVIYASGGSTTTITGTIFSNNAAVDDGGAIDIGSTATMTANNSCFSGNSALAVDSANTTDQDFTNNWWGAADGPSGNGPGTGDSISIHILFSPFLTTGCPN